MSTKSHIIEPMPVTRVIPPENVSYPTSRGVWSHYDANHGIPDGVTALMLDRNGFLWVGARSGLYKYDGSEFVLIYQNPNVMEVSFRSVIQDRSGQIWLALGGVTSSIFSGVVRFDPEISQPEFTHITTDDGLAGNAVSTIQEAPNGDIWIGTGRGVTVFEGQRCSSFEPCEAMIGAAASSICHDQAGRVWVAVAKEGVMMFSAEEQSTDWVEIAHSSGFFQNVVCIDTDVLGQVWFSTGNGHGVMCFNGTEWIHYPAGPAVLNNSVRIYCDRRGRTWFGAWGQGVACLDGDRVARYNGYNGLQGNGFVDICEDQDGGFWIGDTTGGLARFDADAVVVVTENPVLNFIHQEDDRIWYNDFETLSCVPMEASPRQETESAQQVASSRKFPRHIRAFLKDGRGRYWLGGIPNLLYRFDDMASVWKAPVILRIEGPSTPHLDLLPLAQNTPAGISSGNPHVNVMCIIETNDGSVWFGTGNEGETAHGFVCRVDGDSYQSLLTRHQLVVNIVEDQMGRLWLGGWRDGFISVYCPDEDGILKEENLTTFELDTEAARKAVLSLAIDAQGAVLVAYPQGIYRFDPVEEVTIRVTEQLGLPEIWYSAVACTDDGHLWFGTGAAGVYRTDGKHIQQLTEADGLPGNSITRLSPLNNGAIAIGTSRGMAIYTPMATTAPGIEIREVTADTVYTSPDDIVLTHGEMGPVSFSYHGRSFATRRMRYRYTLEGHEDTWHDTWDTLAQYENLKPGEYTFKVIGINRDLIRSPRPATLSLTILENTREQRIAELEHQTSKLEAENIYLQEEIRGQHNFEAIISSGSTLNAVLRQVEQVAATDATVLILGETGTGKELIARAVHHLSSRNEHALVKVNCAALPSGLIESELFGHEQGAFTGALSRKTGRFELADGGTIFLDEIGDLPLELQAKLLRVLQDGEFERLGNPKTMKVDVRIMAATNRDLAEEIERGRFREDLFYRLNVVPLTMPPLRDRKEDISVLVSHFVRQFCAQVGKEIDTIPIHLMERLNSYNWPGNVRELENIVERAVILSSGRELDIGDWLPVPAPEVVSNDTETLKAREKTHILEALRQTEWRVSGSRGAARILGLKPTTLEARMKKLGIKRPV